MQPAFRRVALVVHPTRPIDGALARLTRWTDGIAVLQLANRGETRRRVAAPGEVDAGDLVVAMGGDGTVLTALRTAAARARPCSAWRVAASRR